MLLKIKNASSTCPAFFAGMRTKGAFLPRYHLDSFSATENALSDWLSPVCALTGAPVPVYWTLFTDN
jgi:hypothetical protein